MVSGRDAVEMLASSGVALFVGVPDSLMKGFCAALNTLPEGASHITAPNEGSAVGVAAGHYLATGSPALVYMQNSGLGNAVNPLTSLTAPAVYGIPMVLLVGWRGQPGTIDEPQHSVQGVATVEQLRVLEIPTTVVGPSSSDVLALLVEAIDKTVTIGSPVALLVEKGTFDTPESGKLAGGFKRLEALEMIVSHLPTSTAFIATTGFTGRELAQVRKRSDSRPQSDLLMVGSMGHAVSIALGVATAAQDRLVCCLDGDGALAMHLGALVAVARTEPRNLVHVVFNNRVHESVGSQPTAINSADIPGLAKAAGYRSTHSCSDLATLEALLEDLGDGGGPHLIEIQITPGTTAGLSRPTNFHDRKFEFMKHLRSA